MSGILIKEGNGQPRRRTRLLGINVDIVDLEEAVNKVLEWVRLDSKWVLVTPNLDHALKLRDNPAFRDAYEQAGLVVADGMPLVWLSRLSPPHLPERVAGSDMIVPICRAAAQQGRSLFFIGSTLNNLSLAARRLTEDIPGLVIAGVYAPPFKFGNDAKANEEAIATINAVSPDILLVALGAPRQEIWATGNLDRLNIHAALCIGAGLDFLSGEVDRAPKFVRKTGIEWLWRALSEPRRLGLRYLKIIVALPGLLGTHFRDRAKHADGEQS